MIQLFSITNKSHCKCWALGSDVKLEVKWSVNTILILNLNQVNPYPVQFTILIVRAFMYKPKEGGGGNETENLIFYKNTINKYETMYGKETKI